MKLKVWRLQDPKVLLKAYILGSLIILSACLGIAALVLSWMFTKQEHHRAELSLAQVNSFMEYQYRPIGEEMWTESYEAIGLRIKDIAQQLGGSVYRFELADHSGYCKYAEASGAPGIRNCSTPQELSNGIDSFKSDSNLKPLLHVDRNGTYHYLAPILVGTVLRGYILATFSDPYGFYRGSFMSVAFQFFLPTMAAVLLIWAAWVLISRNMLLRPYFQALVNLQKQEALGNLATQVAHDIRSPLSALNMVIPAMGGVPDEVRQLLRNAVDRITDIANGLILEGKAFRESKIETKAATVPRHNNEPIMPLTHIEKLISEKRLQYSDRENIEIAADLGSGYGKFVSLNPNDLMRVLSNIINNSVEALSEGGFVKVTLFSDEKLLKISVSDNGIGMDESVLARLGTKGFSHGKANSTASGSGLGMYYAKNLMESAGGVLDVRSVKGSGTTTTLTLPLSATPLSFPRSISLKQNLTIVTVDDDRSVHQAWRFRLNEVDLAGSSANHRSFSDLQAFESWMRDFNDGPVFCLIDFDLLDSESTGLDAIERLKLATAALLVTSRDEDENVRERARSLGVKILPKTLIRYIPLEWI